MRNDESSPLVGKKAANVISNYESDNNNESFYSPIIDDKEILDCLLSLPCISSNKKQKRTNDKQKTLVTVYKAPPDHCPKKRCRDTDINQHCHHQMDHYLHNDISDQCYLNLPEDMVEDNPLDLDNIKERQDDNDRLTQSTVKHPTWYSSKTINDVEDILCYTKPGDNAANWRIALPEDLILPTIKWYHQVTGHPGSKRLY